MRYLLILLLLPLMAFAQTKKSDSYVTKLGWEKKDSNVKKRYMTAEVGDSTKAVFDTSINLSMWGGECRFNILLNRSPQLPMASAVKTATTLFSRPDVSIASTDVTHRTYYKEEMKVDDSTVLGIDSALMGALEWEVILHKKPSTNKFTFPIETEGLIFYYQPFLSEAEKERNSYRPAWAEDSYAVYHATRSNNRKDPITGIVEEYKNGKAFHIERPRAWDSDGDTTWCVVRIDTVLDSLTITAPQSFLAKATYPVVIDPTFGYSTTPTGSDEDWPDVNNCAGARLAADHFAAVGADSIYEVYFYTKGNGRTVDIAVYTISSNIPSSLQATSTTWNCAAVYGWVGGAWNYTMTDGVTYGLCVGNVDAANLRSKVDVVAVGASRHGAGTFPATWSEAEAFGFRFGLYANYVDVSAGGEEAYEGCVIGPIIVD